MLRAGGWGLDLVYLFCFTRIRRATPIRKFEASGGVVKATKLVSSQPTRQTLIVLEFRFLSLQSLALQRLSALRPLT